MGWVLTSRVDVALLHNAGEGVGVHGQMRLLEGELSVDGDVVLGRQLAQLLGDGRPLARHALAHHERDAAPREVQQQREDGLGHLVGGREGAREGRVQRLVRHLVVGAFLKHTHVTRASYGSVTHWG